MEKVTGEVRRQGRRRPTTGSIFLVNHNADIALVTLRYRSRTRRSRRRKSRSKPAGKKFNRGSFIIRNVAAADMREGRGRARVCRSSRSAAAPTVKTHPLRAPRVAMMHTWLSTQNEGWWRLAFDNAQVPFTYISTQDVANDAEPEREVRRDRLPARRPRHRRRSSTACRCGATRCRGRRRR